MVWDSYKDLSWKKYYIAAKEYYAEHGDLRVSSTYAKEELKLGSWIANLRSYRKSGLQSAFLTNEWIAELDAIGMIWSKPDSWEVRYALAKVYYDEHGDLNVPPKYTADGVWLNKWLNEQKQIYNGKRNGKSLTQEQIKRLEVIGMTCGNRTKENNEVAWGTHFAECKEYYKQNGHLNISSGYKSKSGANLTVWLVRQRSQYKSGKLSQEQINKLNSIGMIWGLPDTWEMGFAHAKEYAEINGDLLVAVSYVCKDGYRLGNWISNQRSNKVSNDRFRQLSVEQIERLDSMVWYGTRRSMRGIKGMKLPLSSTSKMVICAFLAEQK